MVDGGTTTETVYKGESTLTVLGPSYLTLVSSKHGALPQTSCQLMRFIIRLVRLFIQRLRPMRSRVRRSRRRPRPRRKMRKWRLMRLRLCARRKMRRKKLLPVWIPHMTSRLHFVSVQTST
jgi:hypothetical protein